MAPGKRNKRMAELRRQATWLGTTPLAFRQSCSRNWLCTQAVHTQHGPSQQLQLASGDVAEEEVMYTLFNLAQFLGFVEVVRREGPREDAFLQAGNPQGSDTLATLVEGLRFVMSAASGNLVVSVYQEQCNSAYYQQLLICLDQKHLQSHNLRSYAVCVST